MPEVKVDKKTKWECQRCGTCCRDIIISQNKSLTVMKDGKTVCKFLGDDNLCLDYKNRPFICRVYPFVLNPETMLDKDVARPQKMFFLENLKIHSECPGYGKGKRVLANNNLRKKFEKLGYDFAVNFKESFEQGRDVSEIV